MLAGTCVLLKRTPNSNRGVSNAKIQSTMALGNEYFKEKIERLSGRRVVNLKRGPKGKIGAG